jgi:hypothetical protein
MKGRPASARPAMRPQHFDVSNAAEVQQPISLNEHSPTSSLVIANSSASNLPASSTENDPLQPLRLVTGCPISARPRPRPQSAKGTCANSSSALRWFRLENYNVFAVASSVPQHDTFVLAGTARVSVLAATTFMTHDVGAPVTLGIGAPADSVYAPFPARKLSKTAFDVFGNQATLI